MISVLRSLASISLIVLGGDICGLTIYYLDHLNRWYLLRSSQLALIGLISVITAGAEATQHELPEGDAREKCRRYTQMFFFSLLITLALTYKPL